MPEFFFKIHYIMYKIGMILFPVILFACGRGPDEEALHPEDLHMHENESLQSTLFTKNTEFYIEHGTLEPGEEASFLVHVTDLQTYQPHASGTITIRLGGTTATSDQPARPGIFEVSLVPPQAGDFQITYTLSTGGTTESVTDHVEVHGDHDERGTSEAAAEEDEHGDVEAGELVFLKEQAWREGFRVDLVQAGPFSSVIPTSGEILAVPGEKKSVAASSPGIVHFSEKNLVQGSPVTRGQLLFTISSETLLENNLKLQYQEALNNYERSRSEYERHQGLAAQGIISQRQFMETRSRFISDSLRFHNLSANTSGNGLKVVAPLTGTIHELNVSEGTYARTGEIMVTISSNLKLMIRADLSQRYYGLMSEIVTANFRPAYTDRVYTMEEVGGRLLATGSSVAENDHYLPIIFEVENDGSLLEGAFTEVFLKSSRKKDVVVVPAEALLEEQGGHYLYVQVTGESYTKRAVTTGNDDGLSVEILSGLQPGERVVTEGVMLLKASSMVTGAVGDGHVH